MVSGTLIINGITDEQLRTVLSVKIKNEGSLNFNPQQLQPIGKTPNQQEQIYNNLVLTWNSHTGLHAVRELLQDFGGS